jgi:hypothetical protein
MPEPFCQTKPPDNISQAFVDAVNARQADEVDRLLAQHSGLRDQVNQPWFDFDAPAIVAAKDSEAIVKVLLKHGADINRRSNWWAGSFGVLDGASPEMAQFLIERGARLDIHSAAEQGKTELVEDFLNQDSSLANARGGDGQTPLHVAANLETVDLLLEHGADLSIRCLDHSATAVQYSVSHPVKCRHLLLRGATPDIFLACAIGDRELVEQVLRDEPESISSRVGSCPHTQPVDERSHMHIYTWRLLAATTPLEVAREFNHLQLYD